MHPPPTDRPDGCTRSGAQRRRAKRRQRALRNGVPSAGEGGPLAPAALSTAWGDEFTRGDLTTLRTAIGRDWPIPDEKRAAFVALLMQTLEAATERPRLTIAIGRTAIAMGAADQRDRQR